jgi:hypothetical protein
VWIVQRSLHVDELRQLMFPAVSLILGVVLTEVAKTPNIMHILIYIHSID